jgi:hypothetical protein
MKKLLIAVGLVLAAAAAVVSAQSDKASACTMGVDC